MKNTNKLILTTCLQACLLHHEHKLRLCLLFLSQVVYRYRGNSR